MEKITLSEPITAISLAPKVSICIPTYNGANYLEACLDSVLCQTYNNIEILVVDDGSKDKTLEILDRYAATDQRIQLFHNEQNLGLVGNWNRCIELANGEWIKFVFQDDLIAPECIEKMLTAANLDSSLVFCRRDFIFEKATSQDTKNAYLSGAALVEKLFPNSGSITARQFCEIVLNNMERNIIGEPSVVMLNKRVFNDFGYFNPHLIVSCDTEYWIRVGIHTGVTSIADNLASFRVHGDSVSAKSLQHRDYRMNILDGLAMLHEAVFNISYTPLREVALELSIDLSNQYRKKAIWAYGLAKQAAKIDSNGDNNLINEWYEVAQNFKGLNTIPLKYAIVCKWRSLVSRFPI